LRFFVRDATGHNDITTRMRLKLLKVFEEEGIDIPHPQRDIRIVGPKGADGVPDGDAPITAR
jgi:small-conductance mechanosensitive channel